MKYEVIQSGMSLRIGFFHDVSLPFETKEEAMEKYNELVDEFETDKKCYMHGLDYDKYKVQSNKFTNKELPLTRYEDEGTLQYYEVGVRTRLENDDVIVSESQKAEFERYKTLLYNLIVHIEDIDQRNIFSSGIDKEINITKEEYEKLMKGE